MRLLFEIDTKDYDKNGIAFIRPSSRCINIVDNKVAMIHSLKYNYYKFPGGGIEKNESKIDSLVRETKEEAGLTIKINSIKEYGYVHRIQKSDNKNADYFVQDNYYYICDVLNHIDKQKLDDYEENEKFTLEYVDATYAININRNIDHGPKDKHMIERESKVLELLINDGYIK